MSTNKYFRKECWCSDLLNTTFVELKEDNIDPQSIDVVYSGISLLVDKDYFVSKNDNGKIIVSWTEGTSLYDIIHNDNIKSFEIVYVVISDQDGNGDETSDSESEKEVHNLYKVDYVAPTCTEPGNIEYYVCMLCGLYFKDPEGQNYVTPKDVVIPALGHLPGNQHRSDPQPSPPLLPTCMLEGYHYESINCQRCGVELETVQVIDRALGHVSASSTTCIPENAVEINQQQLITNHSTVDLEDSDTQYFVRSGGVSGIYTMKLPDTDSSVSNQLTIYIQQLQSCGFYYDFNDSNITGLPTDKRWLTEDLDSIWEFKFNSPVGSTDWVVIRTNSNPGENEVIIQQPTCTAFGKKTINDRCLRCHNIIDQKNIRLDKAPHIPAPPIEEVIESTCTVYGKKDTIINCSVCGKQLSKTRTVLELKDHTEGDPVDLLKRTSCVDTHYLQIINCTECGKILKIKDVINPANPSKQTHKWAEQKVVVSIEDDKYCIMKLCVECGHMEELEKIPFGAEINVIPEVSLELKDKLILSGIKSRVKLLKTISSAPFADEVPIISCDDESTGEDEETGGHGRPKDYNNDDVIEGLDESFNGCMKENQIEITDTIDNYMTDKGWIGKKLFEDIGKLKVGSYRKYGWIATPLLNINSGASITFTVSTYGEETGDLSINFSTDNGRTWATLHPPVSIEPTPSTFNIDLVENYQLVRIQFSATIRRFYLHDIRISE